MRQEDAEAPSSERVEVPTQQASPVPEPPQPRDDWLEVATSQRVISREQTLEAQVLAWFEKIGLRWLVKGYNYRRDTRKAYWPLFEDLQALISFLSGLVPDDKYEAAGREVDAFFAFVDRVPRRQRIRLLWRALGHWFYRTRIGMPPTVPEGLWDLTEEDYMPKISVRMLGEAARRFEKP